MKEGCHSPSFDDSVMSRSVATDFLLYCDRLPLLPLIGSSYMAGVRSNSAVNAVNLHVVVVAQPYRWRS